MTINNSSQPEHIQALTTWSDYTPTLPINGPFSWTGAAGQSATVRYTFDASKSFYAGTALLGGGTPSSISSTNILKDAMTAWASVAHLTFELDNATPGLVFGQLATLPLGDDAYGLMLPYDIKNGSDLDKAEITLKTGYNPNLYSTVLHEIAHALGISHPEGGDGTASGYSEDTTIMSDFFGPITTDHPVRSPMIYDIAAAQFLYGANYDYNDDNTTIRLVSPHTAWTIWDGGGDADVFDVSSLGASTDALIDLRGGVDSEGNPYFSQVEDEYVAIAFDPANDSGVVDIEFAVGGAGDDSIYGGYVGNGIFGMGGNDTLVGYSGGDVISGGDNDDVIYDLWWDAEMGTRPTGVVADNDALFGDAGNDTIYGQDGFNFLLGGEGNDTIYISESSSGTVGGGIAFGDKGNDKIYLGSSTNVKIAIDGEGVDTIVGGTLNDTIYGHLDNEGDSIEGGEGNDLIFAGMKDTVFGGGGDDTVIVFSDGDSTLGSGNAWVQSSSGADKVIVMKGAEVSISEGSATDEIWYGNQNITSLSAHWYWIEQTGQGFVIGPMLDENGNTDYWILQDSYGGTGTFLALDYPSQWTILETGITPPNQIQSYTPYAGAEAKIGSDSADTLTGGSGNDAMFGGAGADSLTGGGGNDMITGGAGDDFLSGSTGDDVLQSDDLADTIGGADTVSGGDGNDYIETGAGNDSINAGEGRDIAYAAAGNDTLRGYGGADLFDGGDGDDQFWGGLDNDTLNGGAGADTVSGDEGNDRLEGKAGNDALYGDDGDDVAYGDEGNDRAYGGAGSDRLYGWTGNDSLWGDGDADLLAGDAGTDRLEGGTGNDTIYGGDDADTILGGDDNDQLFADAGDDSVTGGNGNDLVYGWTGNDTVDGEAGNDTISGEDGNDSLTGYTGDDVIFGGAGNDSLLGASGNDYSEGGDGNDYISSYNDNDTIYGGGGQDTLTGGTGLDIFIFKAVSDSYHTGSTLVLDRITDFTKGSDIIDVSLLGYTGIQAGNGSGTTLGFVYSSASDRTYVQAANSDFKFYLTGNYALDASDFDFA